MDLYKGEMLGICNCYYFSQYSMHRSGDRVVADKLREPTAGIQFVSFELVVLKQFCLICRDRWDCCTSNSHGKSGQNNIKSFDAVEIPLTRL